MASPDSAGKIGNRSPRVMRPLVKQSHGIDVGDGIAYRKLAGSNRIERRVPMLGGRWPAP